MVDIDSPSNIALLLITCAQNTNWEKKNSTGIVSISQLEGAGGTRDRQSLLEQLASLECHGGNTRPECTYWNGWNC